jgi:hypothetical protein
MTNYVVVFMMDTAEQLLVKSFRLSSYSLEEAKIEFSEWQALFECFVPFDGSLTLFVDAEQYQSYSFSTERLTLTYPTPILNSMS